MIEAVGQLKRAASRAPVCVGVHAVFAQPASGEPSPYDALLAAGAARVVTTNTIAHPSNAIDVSALLAEACQRATARRAG
jgi:ribose-phosphate pyrophosphokinase